MVFCGPSCFNPFRAGSAEILAAYGGRVQAVHTLRICAVLLCFVGWVTSSLQGLWVAPVLQFSFSVWLLLLQLNHTLSAQAVLANAAWLYMGAAVM
jgi:hypothetical protein